MKKAIFAFGLTMIVCTLVFFVTMSTASCSQAGNLRLVVDGEDITHLSAPVLVQGRTLVPVRFIAETIGAEVIWDGQERSVTVIRGDRRLFMWIDSQLVELEEGRYSVTDVAPQLINARTYVPLRLLSNAFGIGIDWDPISRTVTVDSSLTSEVQLFYDVRLTSIKDGDVIEGPHDLTIEMGEHIRQNAAQTRLLLLEAKTGTGFMVARFEGAVTKIPFVPRPYHDGEYVMVVQMFDRNGHLLGAHAAGVRMAVRPKVQIEGVTEGMIVTEPLSIGQSMNFVAAHVSVEIKSDGYRTITAAERDPLGRYVWTPALEQNGTCTIRVIAYDEFERAYPSEPVTVTVATERKFSLIGVTEGMTVNRPVTVNVTRNFDVKSTEYVLVDPDTGKEEVLHTVPYGGYRWFANPTQAGTRHLYARVVDVDDVVHKTPIVRVTVNTPAQIRLSGVGPNQVVTGLLSLSVESNVDLPAIRYVLTYGTQPNTRVLADHWDPTKPFAYQPIDADRGRVTVQARAQYEGRTLFSESISFTVYLDRIYPARAIIERERFLDFAAGMAKTSWQDTSMSAALQTAQAILETGWGQSVPVDKYTGKFSYNLFGIKGSASNGYVISNTWEVYGGVVYRVDDRFRAYFSIEESWDDHKRLLLTAPRYEPFRDVMHDGVLGAWAIRRAGYATDPLYPIKLMRIMRQHQLYELDRVGF